MSAKAIQYTVRDVPRRVDRILRERAAARGVSLNALLIELMEQQVGGDAEETPRNTLRRFAGTWIDDPAVDAALESQRIVQPGDWE